MPDAKSILSTQDYAKYRNIRAIAVLFVILGSLIALGSTVLAMNGAPQPQSPQSNQLPTWVLLIMMIVGLCGVVGGVCTLNGSRKFAPLIYVMAVPYLLAVPIGTVLSFIVLRGLRGYLNSVDQFRNES